MQALQMGSTHPEELTGSGPSQKAGSTPTLEHFNFLFAGVFFWFSYFTLGFSHVSRLVPEDLVRFSL